MRPFRTHSGIMIPMLESNTDTDQIVPARFLHRSRADGYGQVLFHDLRFEEGGQEAQSFVLNQEPYRDGSVLVAGRNFGCGSSREHAVWALMDYGIRAVIAPSFGDIFFNNSLKNGLLTVMVDQATAQTLAERAQQPGGSRVDIDLERQTITIPGSGEVHFKIDGYRKQALLEGLSEIEMTLRSADEVEAFEERHAKEAPWLARFGT